MAELQIIEAYASELRDVMRAPSSDILRAPYG